MATRIEDIIVRVRDTIGDPNSERWTDHQLLRFIDSAQKQLANQAGLLRANMVLNLIIGVSEYTMPAATPLYIVVLDAAGTAYKIATPAGLAIYTLPANMLKLTRVLTNLGNVLPFQTRSEMDKKYSYGYGSSRGSWELQQGPIPQAIIVDKLEAHTLRVFPTPSSLDTVDSLTVFFTKKARTLTTVLDLLEISDEFDDALKFYTTGMALRMNQDAQNRQMGMEELQAFNAELARAKRWSSSDFISPAEQFDATYVGGV